MENQATTKKQLIDELIRMRQRVATLEAAEAKCRQVEASLRESEERFSRLSEAAFEGIAITDKGKILDVNGQIAKMLGYKVSEMVGLNAMDFVAPESRELVLKNIMAGGEEPYEHMALRKDGSTFPVEVQGKALSYAGRLVRVTAIRDITQRKQAEKKLQESDERLRLALEAARMGTWDWNIPTGTVAWSEQVEQIFGLQPDEFDGTYETYLNLLYPEDRKAMEQAISAILAGDEEDFEVKHRIAWPDGSIHWLEGKGQVYRDEAGKPVRMAGTVTDITERKETEEALQDRLAFETLISAISTSFINLPVEKIDEGINVALKNIAEFSGTVRGSVSMYSEDLKTVTITHEWCANPEDSLKSQLPTFSTDTFSWYFARLKQQDTVVIRCSDDLPSEAQNEKEWFNKKGFRALLIVPIVSGNALIGTLGLAGERGKEKDWSAEFVSLFKFVADIFGNALEHKRAEEEARRRNRELTLLNRVIAATTTSLEPEAILETVCRELVQAFDLSQGVAVLANEEKTLVEVIAEYRLEDQPSLMGHSIPITNNPFIEYLITHRTPLVVEDVQNDPRLDSINHLLRSRGTVSVLMFPLIIEGEMIGGLSLGTDKPRSFSQDEINLVQSVAEQVTGALARARLDEEHQRLEEQYYQAQKMEAVGRLTAGIAHDFNNLLTVINGFTELMKYQIHPNDPLQDELSRILTSGERAANLVRQLLVFSRKQIVEPRVLNLNTTVAEMDKMLQRIIGEDIQLETHLISDLWPVKVDPAQIEQIIVNLAVNARDAMPDGGRLTIETTNVILDDNYANHHIDVSPGEHVLLAISDTGHGMSDEVQSHIFEPFFTTKELGRGTGLGLSTVFGIVKQNNGHIWIYSELGQGATFKVYLPKVNAVVTPIAEHEPIDDSLRGIETILLVEDELAVREVAARILQRQGYKVLEAANGEEALRLSREYQGEIHLLLTDTIMPKMGGRALVDQFKTLYPNTKILFTSGYTDKTIILNGELSPDIAFIPKPFSATALTRKVRAVLDERYKA